MRFSLMAVAAFGVLALGCPAAHADTYSFSFGTAASAFSGSGELTTGSAIAPGEFLITDVTGSVATSPNGAGMTIRSILAPGAFPTPTNGGAFPANDNVLFAFGSTGDLSQYGLSFILSNGAQINLYNDGQTVDDAFLKRNNGHTLSENVPISITAATPEPSSLTLLSTGLLGLAGVARRRFLQRH